MLMPGMLMKILKMVNIVQEHNFIMKKQQQQKIMAIEDRKKEESTSTTQSSKNCKCQKIVNFYSAWYLKSWNLTLPQ